MRLGRPTTLAVLFICAGAVGALVSRAGQAGTTDGLVGHWTFDDGGAHPDGNGVRADDASGNGNVGTLTNMAAAGTNWVAGRIGGAVSFDGTNDSVSVPDSASVSVTGDITLAAWINVADHSAFYVPNIVSKDGNNSYRWRMVIPVEPPDEQMELLLNDGGGLQSIWSLALGPINVGTWYHMAVTVDFTTQQVQFYRDGVAIGASQTTAKTGIADTAGALVIGDTSVNGGEAWNGSLDDIRVYNRVLSQSEIQAIVNYADGGTGTILREFFTGFGGAGVIDLTGNAAYPHNPISRNEPTSWEAPLDAGSDYGTRMRGFIHPLETGDYTFWIASDDNSQLWLSTSEDTADASLIAFEGSWAPSRAWEESNPDEKSSPISLVAGQKYYIEAVHKNGGVPGSLAVKWQKTGWTQSVEPIPGTFMSPTYLMAHWKFDETAGATADDNTVPPFVASAANGSDGTVNGTASWQPSDGRIGGALVFDGSTNYVTTGRTLLNNVSEFTTAGWINTSDLAGRNGLWGQDGNYELYIWSSQLYITTTAGSFGTDYSPYSGGWHHVAVVGDGATAPYLTLYIDGVAVATGGWATGSYGAGGTFNIGQSVCDASGDWFTGSMDDVRVYFKALSAGEIADLAMDLDSHLVLHLKLDEASGTTAVDSSPNGFDGTLTNMTGSEWSSGKLGGALQFDDSEEDHINVADDDSLDVVSSFTISTWFKIDTLTDPWVMLVSKGDNAWRLLLWNDTGGNRVVAEVVASGLAGDWAQGTETRHDNRSRLRHNN